MRKTSFVIVARADSQARKILGNVVVPCRLNRTIDFSLCPRNLGRLGFIGRLRSFGRDGRRVDASADLFERVAAKLASGGDADLGELAQRVFAGLPGEAIADGPRFCAARLDYEIEATAKIIGDFAPDSAGLQGFDAGDGQGRHVTQLLQARWG
jgi:hypothetical protein